MATKGVLGELAKRVPKNQNKQFKTFLDLSTAYKNKVNKYPEKLPTIDWDYYRTNVRMEAVKLVDEFEKKYEELNKIFNERHKLDTKKYYDELEKQRAVVQAEVKKYIAESNERIKAYEAEILRLCTMKPYSSMTMEEFITLRPECATYIPFGGKPLFWPHTPEEQKIGPVGLPKPDGGEGGGGDDNGAGGAGQPFTPSDLKEKTESFEFKPVEAPPPPKTDHAKPAAQAETKPAVDTTELATLKRHVEQPASEERKQELDPCKLEEKLKQTSEPKAQPAPESKTEPKAAIKTTSQTKSTAATPGPAKKPHPCDLVKKKVAFGGAEACEDAAPKGPYKDGEGGTCVFFDPCKVQFGARPKSDAKAVEKTPAKDKTAVKTDTKELPKEPGPPKKPHPCDLVKKKMAVGGAEACKDAPKGPYKDGEGGTCTFFDPCKVEFGARTKSDVKGIEQASAKDKAAVKTVMKELPKEIKKPTAIKDTCKDAAKKGPNKDEKDGTCAIVFACKEGKTEKGAKVGKAAKCEGEAKIEKTVKTEKCVDKEAKPKPEIKTSSTCQSTASKEPKKETKSIKDIKKPKVEADIIKDKNSCTMVFAEPPKADKKPQGNEKKSGDSCSQTPYFNPFRSDEENRKQEEKSCDGESEEPDYCGDEERESDKDYYNPCRDEKK